MNSLLAAERQIAWNWSDYFKNVVGEGASYNVALASAFSTISTILWIILGIVGAMGAVYAIWLGIQLARAEDQGKRDEAKKHLITVIIAVGVTVLLILFFNTLLPAILSAFNTQEGVDSFINLLRK